MPTLFDPIALGAIDCPNRIIMAPLTRGRADPGHIPSAMMVEYYRQRAGAGLIISEATGISQEGLGWPNAPGIYTDAMVDGWRRVTDAVHDAGGRIILQLWHMGRLVHSSFNNGKPPVSASATRYESHLHTNTGRQDAETAQALTVEEIGRVVGDYAAAARNAMRAGFDGVQVHGANGYLIDQFLRDRTNLRDDDYGGPPANRIRFLREVVEAVTAEAGAARTSVRLSPNGETQGVDDSDPAALFGAAATMLKGRIGFLELREPGPDGTFGNTEVPRQSPLIRKAFGGPLVLNSDYTRTRAEADVAEGRADAISFGRPFISNPDLVERLRARVALTPDNPRTWYSQGPEGYIDYPVAT